MELSKAGLDLIKNFEGFSNKAYKCHPSEKYYTIGYGHYGADVKPNATITKTGALDLLKKDLVVFEKNVNTVNVRGEYNFTQNQFDALVSFTYNCGYGNLLKITNNCKRTKNEISNAFGLYCKCNGNTLLGLVKRRNTEQKLFDLVNNDLTKKIKYYKKSTSTSIFLDDVLKSCGVESKYLGSYKKRKPIADINGIKNYTGTTKQNLKLIDLAKTGKLVKKNG